MAETLGGLIDRLTIVNIKRFHIDKKLAEYTKLSRPELEKLGFDELQGKLEAQEQLRLDRERLIAEIDERLAESARTGQTQVDARVKLT